MPFTLPVIAGGQIIKFRRALVILSVIFLILSFLVLFFALTPASDDYISELSIARDNTVNKDFIYSYLHTLQDIVKNAKKETQTTVEGLGNMLENMTNAEFLDRMAPFAVYVYTKYGILPGVTLSMAAQESGWGKHSYGYNFFGNQTQDQNLELDPDSAERVSFQFQDKTLTAGPVKGKSYWAVQNDPKWYVYYPTMKEAADAFGNLLTGSTYEKVKPNEGATTEEQLNRLGPVYNGEQYASVVYKLYKQYNMQEYDPGGTRYEGVKERAKNAGLLTGVSYAIK